MTEYEKMISGAMYNSSDKAFGRSPASGQKVLPSF